MDYNLLFAIITGIVLVIVVGYLIYEQQNSKTNVPDVTPPVEISMPTTPPPTTPPPTTPPPTTPPPTTPPPTTPPPSTTMEQFSAYDPDTMKFF